MCRCVPATLKLEKRYTHLGAAFASIWREEGIRGFYRGYSTAAVIVPVFWAIYFPCYNTLKVGTPGNPPSLPPPFWWV